ncbi:hypothetical protein FACS189459_3110 [Bacilli bacterium]|nr:hypothetical protein FACS189459_3110 [Bacilli bacterium]
MKKVDKGEKKHAQYEVENIHTKEIKVMSSNVLSILNIRRGKNTKSGRPTAK